MMSSKYIHSFIKYLDMVTALPAIEFGDNGDQKYLTEQNGVATVVSQVREGGRV